MISCASAPVPSPVAAKRITKSAASAWLMKCLVPVTTQSSPSRTARVRMPRRSEPASGSVIARHSVRSPRDHRQQVALALVALAGQQDPGRPGDGEHLQRVAGVAELALHRASRSSVSRPPPPTSSGMLAA